MRPENIRIEPAAGPRDWAAVRALLREYALSLDIDLGFQGFEAELAGLPGAYAPPGGIALLARVDGAEAACGAVRPRPDLAHVPVPGGPGPRGTVCEMKRLYVRPTHRGLGLGRRVAEALMAHARAAGHDRMLLDTLATMQAAQALYAALGFVDVPAYYDNPLAGARYLGARL